MRSAYHAPVCPWAPGCGCMIHHNEDSERHKVLVSYELFSELFRQKTTSITNLSCLSGLGVKELKKQQ